MAKHTIKIKKYADVIEEYVCGRTNILPGMLVEVTATNLIQPHTNSAGIALAMFALEDELQGRGIDVQFTENERVQCWLPGHGDMVYGLLADGETADIGEWLESNGDGYLKVGTTAPIGQVVEAVDMSDSSSADPLNRVIVRIN